MNETAESRHARSLRHAHERMPPGRRDAANPNPACRLGRPTAGHRNRYSPPHRAAAFTGLPRQWLASLDGMLELSRRLVENGGDRLAPRQVDYAQALYAMASELRLAMARRVPMAGPARAGLGDQGVEALMRERGDRLIRANARLRQEIADRERAEVDLLAARRAAEAASAAKSDFLANMSHEIRTPMNGILGMTELALRTALNGEQREYLDLVKASADALLVVIDDVLDFSKIEAGCLALENAPFALRDCVIDSVKSLALNAERKRLELACEIDPRLPDTPIGDPARLRQILINLVGNAIKFTERGHVVVLVRELARDDGGVVCQFSVRDSGIGIPADRKGTIFSPYRQADSSIARRFGGTGLGLSISARLAGLMGGRVWVDSEPGAGSTFHFTARFGLAGETADGPDFGGLKVLVAEHRERSRGGLSAWLRACNVALHEAVDGGAVLAAIAEAGRAGQDYDLVLLADDLPGLDGIALADRIRRGALPGAGTAVLLGSILRQGGSAWPGEAPPTLTRPVKPSELRALLGTLCAAHGAAPAAPPHDVAPEADPARLLDILVVEDNPVNRRLAEGVLSQAGHRVTTAESGEAAIESLARGRFDLVLMDLRLSGMDGIETTARIRAREAGSGRHLPIVGLSAHSQAACRERCLAAGMDDYLVKPVRPMALLAAVERSQGPGGMACPGVPLQGAPKARPLIDLAALLERVGGDTELLAEIIPLFRRNGLRLVRSGRKALKAGDAEQFRQTMHTLVGMLNSLAADEAAAIAARLETAGGEMAAPQLGAGLRELAGAMVRFGVELKRIAGALRAQDCRRAGTAPLPLAEATDC